MKMDRISNLPDELIYHIVSLLSAKEAAFALVLSKRWRNLFTIIPRLHFNDWSKKVKGSLMDLSNVVTALPLSARIKEVSLRCQECVDSVLINRFLCNVMKRGILSVELDLPSEKGYSLPSEIFTCKTIVKLKLGKGFHIAMVPDNAYLPSLKIIDLDQVRFFNQESCAFEALLSACPVLEELFIYGVDWEHWKWSRTISSPTLQRLEIERTDYNGSDDASDFRSITFDTPSLVYLMIRDVVPNEYPIANLDSVVEAKLTLFLSWWHGRNGHPLSSDPTNLIKGLRNVKILKLMRPHTVALLYYFREAIPVFENLFHLTVPSSHGHCWKTMPTLLNNSPNLKTFVIKGPLHYDPYRPKSVCECLSGYSWLLSCPVEVLEITSWHGTIGELEHIKHFLWKLPHLKLVKVRVWGPGTNNEEKLKLTTDLQMLPRASVNCKIHVSFS